MNCHANKCIECTVSQCAHHCGTENYCSLDSILVGTHECNPTQDQCTDCMSLHTKKGETLQAGLWQVCLQKSTASAAFP